MATAERQTVILKIRQDWPEWFTGLMCTVRNKNAVELVDPDGPDNPFTSTNTPNPPHIETLRQNADNEKRAKYEQAKLA